MRYQIMPMIWKNYFISLSHPFLCLWSIFGLTNYNKFHETFVQFIQKDYSNNIHITKSFYLCYTNVTSLQHHKTSEIFTIIVFISSLYDCWKSCERKKIPYGWTYYFRGEIYKLSRYFSLSTPHLNVFNLHAYVSGFLPLSTCKPKILELLSGEILMHGWHYWSESMISHHLLYNMRALLSHLMAIHISYPHHCQLHSLH